MDHSQMKHIMTEKGLVMVHGGIPGWMFGLGVGLIVILSFVIVEWRGLREGEGPRINLTASVWMRKFIRQPYFRFIFQAPILLIFMGTIFAGLTGNYARNIAPVMVWTIWWAGLIFAVAMFGNLWCFVCPWDALATLVERLSFWKRRPSGSLGWTWPSWAQNVYPALILFVGVTWLELGFGVTNHPRLTAILGLAMALSAMAMALLFDRRVFCQSLCFVGRTSGMYSMFSPVEVRSGNPEACAKCKTLACMNGNKRGLPCPTGLNLRDLNDSMYCTNCTECFSSCPSVPVLNIRPFGRDLSRVTPGRKDEAWLALVLFALTAFHGLSMTPVWQNFEPGSRDIVGTLREFLGSHLLAFTLGMAVIMAIPILAHVITTWIASRWVEDQSQGYSKIFVAYSYSVLPVALFYHLAHNAMHLLMEGPDIIPLLSDPMGAGADWFGTASWEVAPIMAQQNIWYLQVGLILVGHIFGVIVAHRISRGLFSDPRDSIRSLVPMLVFMVSLSVLGLWLMSLDMNMRMGRM
jgi:hypothetical protein